MPPSCGPRPGCPHPAPVVGAGPAGRAARRRLRDSRAARRLAGLGAAVAGHPAGRAVAGFLPELRPAWWVLRGYLAVQAAAVIGSFLFTGVGLSFPLPALFDSRVLGLLATVAAVAGSVWLGRRGPGGTGRRVLLVAGNAVLAVFAVAMLVELGANEANADLYHPDPVLTYTGPVSGLRSDGNEITNIFPFDAKGRPLKDVYLVDQDGAPVVATHYDNEYLEPTMPVDGNGDDVPNRYPQVQHELDPAGVRQPARTPEFRPPPGPVGSP